MKNVWNSLLLLITMNVNAQNLVPNPSFEDTISCPDLVNQLNLSVGWSAFRLSPDYLNSCSGFSLVGVPSNWAGYQIPRSGNAYAGFYTIYTPTQHQNPRECIGIQLIQPLIPGHEYYVSLNVSRAVNEFQFVNLATNKIGAKFTNTLYSLASPVPLNNVAHVYTDSVISDTVNWVEIKGFFISDSAYQYLSIGNFFDDSSTTYIRFDSISEYAYYYLDDILVADSTPTAINKITPGKLEIFPNPFQDELIIEGDKIELISVFDVFGRKIIERVPVSTLNKIKTDFLTKGFYFVEINTSENSFIRRILKQ